LLLFSYSQAIDLIDSGRFSHWRSMQPSALASSYYGLQVCCLVTYRHSRLPVGVCAQLSKSCWWFSLSLLLPVQDGCSLRDVLLRMRADEA
jgi:hypothetical protein